MGLSIHYSGSIKKISLINDLIIETADICNILDWKYHVIEKRNEFSLHGIIFSPSDCEPVMLTFLTNRKMCSFINLKHRDIFDGVQVKKSLLYTISTKTQFAGADAHIALIKLLRYLSGKYFKEFKLIDEGMYWETNDESIFRKQFARYEIAMDLFEHTLKNMKKIPGETGQSLAKRIEDELKERWGDKDN
jgi:hypothetical protein